MKTNIKRTYRTKKVIAKEKAIKKQINIWIAFILVTITAFGVVGGVDKYTGNYILRVSTIQTVQAVEITPEEPVLEPVEDMIRRLAKEANFQWSGYLVRLAICESGLDPTATNGVGNYPTKSRDRGLFQISSYWHYEVTDAQAYDAEWATKWTMDMINNGRQSEWVCNQYI